MSIYLLIPGEVCLRKILGNAGKGGERWGKVARTGSGWGRGAVPGGDSDWNKTGTNSIFKH